jgi:hypothetical protein
LSWKDAHASLCHIVENLSVDEIAFVRLAAYEAMMTLLLPDPTLDTSKDTDELAHEIATGKLSE